MPVPPGTLAALGGRHGARQPVGVEHHRRPSGSTARSWCAARRRATSRCSSTAPPGFGESTSDLAWDGHGLIADRGNAGRRDAALRARRHARAGRRRPARAGAGPHAADLVRRQRPPARAADAHGRVRARRARRARRRRLHRARAPRRSRIRSCPPIRRSATSAAARSSSSRRLRWRAGSRRCRPRRAAASIGVSGGQDSTHALLVAAHALDLLALERRHLVAVTMPGFGTTGAYARQRRAPDRAPSAPPTARSRSPALGEAVYAAIGHPPEQEDVTFENVQAWLRKLLLFATASQDARHRRRHRRPLRDRARLVHVRRRPHVALWRQRRRAEDADHVPDHLGGRGDLRATSRGAGRAARHPGDADQPRAAAPERRRRDRAALRGHRRPLRAARLLPLPLAALRLRPAPHRPPGAARLRRSAMRWPTSAAG